AYEGGGVGEGQWSVVVDGPAHEVAFLGTDRLRVDGHETTVTLTDERTVAARGDRSAVGSGRHEIRAPMPGFLKAVHVAEGDVVEQDAPPATPQAMKMENEARPPAP